MLYAIARSRLAAVFIGQIFAHLSFLIPVRRLRETDTLLAFYHPQPSYPIHILLVPKKALPNLMALSAADTPFLTDLFQTIQSLATELKLDQVDYRIVANGGAYQAVPQLHFHLIAEKRP